MSEPLKLNKEQIAIMRHAYERAPNGLYCGDSPDMQRLLQMELMELRGRKSYVPEPYFTLTLRGRAILQGLRDGTAS